MGEGDGLSVIVIGAGFSTVREGGGFSAVIVGDVSSSRSILISLVRRGAASVELGDVSESSRSIMMGVVLVVPPLMTGLEAFFTLSVLPTLL